LKQFAKSVAAFAIIVFASAGTLACEAQSDVSVHVANGEVDPAKEQRVHSLLQLIVRPDKYDGETVDVGAYIILDLQHRLGILEYGLDEDDGNSYVVDSSPIGFNLQSPWCRTEHEKPHGLLSEEDIIKMFSAQRAAYGFVQGLFEKEGGPLEGGRICDITGLRLLSDSADREKE
jgi:hypothetical protein